jgi:hypothetical protein
LKNAQVSLPTSTKNPVFANTRELEYTVLTQREELLERAISKVRQAIILNSNLYSTLLLGQLLFELGAQKTIEVTTNGERVIDVVYLVIVIGLQFNIPSLC